MGPTGGVSSVLNRENADADTARLAGWTSDGGALDNERGLGTRVASARVRPGATGRGPAHGAGARPGRVPADRSQRSARVRLPIRAGTRAPDASRAAVRRSSRDLG